MEGIAHPRTLALKIITVLLLSPPSILAQTSTTSNAPESGKRANHQSWSLASVTKRVVFDSAPFSAGATVPYWDNGYLISFAPETSAPNTPNVRLYGPSGTKVRESAIWFQDSQSVNIHDAAASPKGNIIVSGTAFKSDGTKASFIAETDLSGSVIDVIQTNPFHPSKVCSAPDGTIWSFGDLGFDSNDQPTEANLLREFDVRRGLLREFLTLSTFGQGIHRPPDQMGNPGQEVFFRCFADRIFIYTGVADQFIAFDSATGSTRRFKLDRSTTDLPVHGFAITESGEVFGELRDYANPKAIQGLFRLDLDEKTGRASWVPVRGASGIKGDRGMVSFLWGAEGQDLVHGYVDDPAGRSAVHWSTVKPVPSSQASQ